MADLITLTNWQNQRGVPVAANVQESLIISECSARIEEFCGRTFAQAAYTEFISGNDTNIIWLRNRPLTATGLSVWQDDAGYFGQAAGSFDVVTSLLTIGVDYALVVDQPDGVTSRSGQLLRINTNWRKPQLHRGGNINPTLQAGSGNVKVSYTAGYATVPLDVQQACMLLCATVKQRTSLGEAFQAENRETYGYQLRPWIHAAFGALPADALAILARYRNLAVG